MPGAESSRAARSALHGGRSDVQVAARVAWLEAEFASVAAHRPCGTGPAAAVCMCTTKLSVMAAALSLLALGLGPGAPLAHAQYPSLAELEYEAPPPLEPPRANAGAVAQRRLSLGLGIAGIVTGAVGLLGGSVLLIAGTSRTHCEGSWLSGSRRCSSAPDDTGDVAGGVLSIGLGLVAVIAGIVLAATRPRRSGPTLSFGGDSSSASVSIDGTF